MIAAILLLLLIALLFGIGLAAKAAVFLIWVAIAMFVLWLIGWAAGAGASAGSRRRWYYW